MILTFFSFLFFSFLFLLYLFSSSPSSAQPLFVPNAELSSPAARACALLGGSACTWCLRLPYAPLDSTVRVRLCCCPTPCRAGTNLSSRAGCVWELREAAIIGSISHLFFENVFRSFLSEVVSFYPTLHKTTPTTTRKLCQTRLYLKN
jgi:hypothetical protein